MTKRLSDSKVSSMAIIGYIPTPDGATVTPVDDYTIWLRCAELPNTYGSLANVIADTTAMETLCNNLNALRYMVRGEDTIMPAVLADSDWVAELDGSIYAVHTPTMVSNISPSGMASTSSGTLSNAYLAFDKNLSTYHVTNTLVSELTQWMQYMFPNEICLYKYTIRAGDGQSGGFNRVKLYGSTNGSAFDDLGWSDTVPFNTTTTFKVVVPIKYKYFRVANGTAEIDSMSTARFHAFELDFYGLDLS